MTTFFTSDPHFGHQKMSDLRGFDDTVDHDLEICCNWANVVNDNDTVYVLGDVCLSKQKLPYALSAIASLPGRKRLISGNHDACWPGHREHWKWLSKYMEVFESVSPFARIKYEGRPIFLSHFPYTGDSGEGERYSQYRLKDEGHTIIHGHTHSSEVVSYSRRNSVQLHAGLDAWKMKPVSIDELMKAAV